MSEVKKKIHLPEFQTFLSTRKLAPEKNIPFYAYWVSKFLSFCNMQPATDCSRTIAEFLQSLIADQRIADWQVSQAEEAVKLYVVNFKGIIAPHSDVEPAGTEKINVERLLDEARQLIRLKHYSYSTERTYLDWINRFFQYMRQTKGALVDRVNSSDIKDYLTHLAITKHVSSSTQNQAFNSLLFLFRDVLKADIGDISDTVRAKRGQKLPVVLSIAEVKAIFDCLSGTGLLIAQILYGSGLRLMELARLRIMDVDFNMQTLTVRSGKGDKDRTTVLPETVKDRLRDHVEKVKALHKKDLAQG